MSEENLPPIEIIQSNVFKKAFDKLSEANKDLVDDEIAKILADPEIGTQKKGDLSYLWVHKFKLSNREVLLGYSWVEERLELYLLNMGPHENFYKDAKNRRSADNKLLK